jgi:putative endonuclease
VKSHELGIHSETLASNFLRSQGWCILERNYRAGRKEIDIIARNGNVVAFVEVKARAGTGYGHPLYAITWKKRREIAHVARVWLERNPLRDCDYRFDAVAICWSGSSHTVEHVEDAWRIDIR